MKNPMLKILIVITVLGFFLRAHGINYYSYGDEHFHVYNSLGLGSGQLPRNFHRVALFAFYGGFYAVGWVIGIFRDPAGFIGIYFSDRHVFYYAGRFFETLAGTAAIPLLYLLGKKMFSRTTGLIAALFLAVSPVAVEISQIARGQALCLLLLTAAMYFVYPAIGDRRRGVRYFLAGLTFGAAVSIRFFGAVVIIPLLFFHFRGVAARTPGASGSSSAFPVRLLAVLKGTIFNPGVWLFITGFAAAYAVSAPRAFTRFSRVVVSHLSMISIGEGVGEGSVTLGSEVANPLNYYIYSALPEALSWPVYILSGLALVLALFKLKKPDYSALVLCVFVFLLALSRGTVAAGRYLFPILPALFLLAGDSLVSAAARLRASDRSRNFLALAAAVLIAVVPAEAAFRGSRYNRMPTTKDLSQNWILANFPEGTRIAVESMGYRGPDLKLIPVLDFWMYNLEEDELRELYEERRGDGYASIALRYFIENPPRPRYYLTSISVREIIDVERLKEEEFQYIVTVSGNREIYRQEITRERYPEHYQSRKLFYPWLEEEGELIKVFSPDERTRGDEVRIYKVR